jgi:maleate isomerase
MGGRNVAEGGRKTRAGCVGVILLATDLTTERDIRLIAPPDLPVCATRIAYANPTTPDNLRATLPHLGAAAALLVPGIPLAAIIFACTSASVILGRDAVLAAIAEGRPGVPVITPADAAVAALRAIDARRIAILTPYLPETTVLVQTHLAGEGIDILRAEALGIDDDRWMARHPAATIRAAARRAVHPDADALFISCTALPATEIVPEIEAEIGRPVITSNLATLWQALRLAGRRPARQGLGHLLDGDRTAA